jgi:hypothetical protein
MERRRPFRSAAMIKKLLLSALVTLAVVAFSFSAPDASALTKGQTCVGKCESDAGRCNKPCRHLSGKNREFCEASCDGAEAACLSGCKKPVSGAANAGESKKCQQCESALQLCNRRCSNAVTPELKQKCENRCSITNLICRERNRCDEEKPAR